MWDLRHPYLSPAAGDRAVRRGTAGMQGQHMASKPAASPSWPVPFGKWGVSPSITKM